jgi:hypothetical protein
VIGLPSACASVCADDTTMLWVWQVQRLCHQDTGRLVRVLQSRLTEDARLAYIMPDPPDRDRVIDVARDSHLIEEVA